eukprot:TRINITY_DN6708_c0_g1_i2.p1 TRINITY_DN6708_c0_g1~~TRINITY_DN6708_c0_g1_i2.p1  ORF type:complete len:1041 (+),score=319.24 TRINITY_DN6708_c0_g1_i2:133-3255(+)
MDVQNVLTCLQYTLSPYAEQRKQAEVHLKQYERMNGYSVVLLKIVASDQVDVNLRQSAAIQLKTLIRGHWSDDPDSAYSFEDHAAYIRSSLERKNSTERFLIAEEDRQLLKANLVEAIIHAPPKVRTQISIIHQFIVDYDFPEKWPEVLPKITAYLNSKDLRFMTGALEALRRTIRKYEYMPTKKKNSSKKRLPLFQLVDSIFPLLIQIFQAAAALNTLESAEMQFLLVRIFWSSINMGITPYFYNEQNLMPWMNQMLQLLQRPVPADQQPADLEDRPKSQWWKAKKWAAMVFVRMFQRFGDAKMIDDTPADKLFAKRFTELYIPKLLECFVGILQQKQTGYTTDRLVHSALTFLTTGIRRNGVYKQIKSSMDVLWRETVFPLLCFSNSDQQLWHEDPQEYMRKELDVMDEYNPRSAAIGLTMDLGTCRSKNHLGQMMQFVASILQKCLVENNPRIKDGALTAIGVLNDKLLQKSSPYVGQIEPLITTFVIPEFVSPHGFLRAKAAWFSQQFFEHEFQNPEIFLVCLRSTLNLLSDKELPVRVTAALSLKHLMQSDLAADDIRKIFPSVIELYFKLMKEIDNDELVNSLQVIVDRFPDDIAPFAVSTIQRMVEAFLRMVDSDEEDSMVAALECLNAIQSVLDVISEKPDLFVQAVPYLLPMLHKMLNVESGSEFFDELLRVVSFVTCFSPTITEPMWQLFPKIVQCYEAWGNDYISDLLVPFDNYISRGTDVFLQGNYIQSVLKIFQQVVSDEDAYDDHACEAAKFVEVILFNCKGKVDQYLEPMIEISMKRLNTAKKSSLKVMLLETVAASLFYNPVMTLKILESRNWTQGAFTMWFSLLPKFNRTHDKKVALLGLISLLTVPMNQLPPVIIAGMKSLLTTLIDLSHALEKQRAEIEEENERYERELQEGEEEPDEDPGDWEEEEEGAGELNKLAQDAAAHAEEQEDSEDVELDDDDDEDFDDLLEEEENFSSAIDDLDEIVLFIDTMKDIAARDAQSYANLISHLNPAHQKSYNELIQLAEKKKIEIQQQLLQKQQQQ